MIQILSVSFVDKIHIGECMEHTSLEEKYVPKIGEKNTNRREVCRREVCSTNKPPSTAKLLVCILLGTFLWRAGVDERKFKEVEFSLIQEFEIYSQSLGISTKYNQMEREKFS